MHKLKAMVSEVWRESSKIHEESEADFVFWLTKMTSSQAEFFRHDTLSRQDTPTKD